MLRCLVHLRHVEIGTWQGWATEWTALRGQRLLSVLLRLCWIARLSTLASGLHQLLDELILIESLVHLLVRLSLRHLLLLLLLVLKELSDELELVHINGLLLLLLLGLAHLLWLLLVSVHES